MEEALHDTPLFREVAGVGWNTRLPDESTILRLRQFLKKHKLAVQILTLVNELLRDKGLLLKAGTVVDAPLIAAPSSTKNVSGERDPDMHQTKKGNQWYFGMKAHIGVDAESGLVHTVHGTAANVNDVVQANSLLHGQESDVFADAGYQGAHKGANAKPGVDWHVAMRPGKRRAVDKTLSGSSSSRPACVPRLSIRFGWINRQIGHVKGALPRAQEEHRATDHAVRAVEPADGAQGT